MGSLIERDKSEAKKKAITAAAAWGSVGLWAATIGLGPISGVVGVAGAGYLTYRWFMFRAKRGMRF